MTGMRTKGELGRVVSAFVKSFLGESFIKYNDLKTGLLLLK
jgi:hypothetical protein